MKKVTFYTAMLETIATLILYK